MLAGIFVKHVMERAYEHRVDDATWVGGRFCLRLARDYDDHIVGVAYTQEELTLENVAVVQQMLASGIHSSVVTDLEARIESLEAKIKELTDDE